MLFKLAGDNRFKTCQIRVLKKKIKHAISMFHYVLQ